MVHSLFDAFHDGLETVTAMHPRQSSFLSTDDWAHQVSDTVKKFSGKFGSLDSVDVPSNCANGANYRKACPNGWMQVAGQCKPILGANGKHLTPDTPENVTMLFPGGTPWKTVAECVAAQHGPNAAGVCEKCPRLDNLSFRHAGKSDVDKHLFEVVCKVKWPCNPPANGRGVDYSASHGNMCGSGWRWNSNTGSCMAPLEYQGPCAKERSGAAFATPWMKRRWATMCNVRYPHEKVIGNEAYELLPEMVGPDSKFAYVRMAAMQMVPRMRNITMEAKEWWDKSNGHAGPSQDLDARPWYHTQNKMWKELDSRKRLDVLINRCLNPLSTPFMRQQGIPPLNALDLGCAESVRDTLISLGYTKTSHGSVLHPTPLVVQAYGDIKLLEGGRSREELGLLKRTFGDAGGLRKVHRMEKCMAAKLREQMKQNVALEGTTQLKAAKPSLGIVDGLYHKAKSWWKRKKVEKLSEDCGLWADLIVPALKFPLQVPLSLTFAAVQAGFVPHITGPHASDGRVLFWPSMPKVQEPRTFSDKVAFANTMYAMLGSQQGSPIAGHIGPEVHFMKRHQFADVVDRLDDCTRNYYNPCPAQWTQINLPHGIRCEAPEGYQGPCERSFEGSRMTYTMRRAFAEHCNAPWPCEGDVFLTPHASKSFWSKSTPTPTVVGGMF